jgi:hypothetical protein
MKQLFLSFLLLSSVSAFAGPSTDSIPLGRQLFHDHITDEQKKIDKQDGKQDGIVHVSLNDEVNQTVTDAVIRKVNEMTSWVEKNKALPDNNAKVRYLRYIEEILRSYRTAWRNKQLTPTYAPMLIENFETVMKLQLENKTMTGVVTKLPYEVGKIITEVFADNKGYKESKNILFLKFCAINPDKILQNIEPFANEPFADSLVRISAKLSPLAIYNYALAPKTVIGKLVHNSEDPFIVKVAELSRTQNALLYFPFLDDIYNNKKSIEDIKKYVGDGEEGYDSINYYKLLVSTEIAYSKRMTGPAKDTPMAMFGPNGLRETLQEKAIKHFVNPINELHEKAENVRMKAVDSLSSIDLYYMLVTGESEIYTSSYKHSFNRLIQRLGANPHTDSLLMNVNFDYFKRFIKMAANYNKLDTFLHFMPAAKAELVMKAFVANLENTGNLEDAVDVADAYSSIHDKGLQNNILGYVKENERRSIESNNIKGKVIYGLLKTIFLSADSTNKIDLTSTIGIPSIYTVDNSELVDDSGRIVEQVFFYGDEDGKNFYGRFVNSFSDKNQWRVTTKKEWVEIKSIKGKKVWIFANRPLDSDANLDDSAQIHLNSYLYDNDINPSVVTHRGHSYWLPRTLQRMPDDAKIVVLGSCGGYKNLSTIIRNAPNAHIISTKEIGKGDINQPITNYLNQTFLSGKQLVWKNMWASLTKTFASGDKDVKESWDDYVPPYKNLGAIFIKAYNKKMEEE